MDSPTISLGTPAEYAYWLSRWRQLVAERGGNPDNIEQVDARFNYEENRITLYRLTDGSDPFSVAETLSHEYLHALLYQMGEYRAARQIDLVSAPARSGSRTGGV